MVEQVPPYSECMAQVPDLLYGAGIGSSYTSLH